MTTTFQTPSFPTLRLLPYAGFTGFLGFLPVPILDDWSASLARAAMLRRIARHHGKLLQSDALKDLSRHASPTPRMPARAALKAASLVFRRMFVLVNAAGAADEALHTLVLGHLFDRYLAQRHPAADTVITPEHARALHSALDTGIRTAARGALRDIMLQSVLAGADAAHDIPEALRRTLRLTQGFREDDTQDENGLGVSATFLADLQQALMDCRDCYLKDVDAAFDRSLPAPRRRAAARARETVRAPRAPHTPRRHRAAHTMQ